MATHTRLIVVYSSQGDIGAFLQYPYLFNLQGEWIGWVTATRQVYSVHGHYVGWLSNEPRILRKHATGHLKPQLEPPPRPMRLLPPPTVPLAPMLPEVPIGAFDVLAERPDLLPNIDTGELRDDMD